MRCWCNALGAAITLVPVTAVGINAAINGWQNEMDPLAFLVFGVPLGIIGVTYLSSAIYGFRANARCTEMQDAAVEESQQPAPQPVPKPIVGQAPLYCVVTDLGPCFFDEADCKDEAERAGGSCEARDAGWCFDVSKPGSPRPDTTCAASSAACEAHRAQFIRDPILTVSTCGAYTTARP